MNADETKGSKAEVVMVPGGVMVDPRGTGYPRQAVTPQRAGHHAISLAVRISDQTRKQHPNQSSQPRISLPRDQLS